jgi:hypothetical protein
MNAALLWKEYRQQRALWLTVFLVAAFLAISMSVTLHSRHEAQFAVAYSLMSIAVAYGVIAGALSMASEREDGTLDFLERLAGRRNPIWRRKLGAGIGLVFSQSLALAVVALIVGFSSSDNAFTMFAAGLNGMAWGMLAGARCRTVLIAVLMGIALMLGSWALAFILSALFRLPIFGVEAGLGLAAFYASWRSFCRDDSSRRPPPARTGRPLVRVIPASWRAVLWLAFRQGRWALAAVGAGTLLLGVVMIFGLQIVFWPAGTLLLGLICGLGVFSADQNGKQFLASQRIPLGLYWTVKTIFWLFIIASATALAWYLGTGLHAKYESEAPSYLILKWAGWNYPDGSSDPALLVAIWPLYGFCVGHFLGMMIRRPAVSVFLAIVLTPVITVMWAPSLILSGVSAWWVFIIPALLLLTARLAMRPWASARLMTFRPILGLSSTAALMVICLSAFFWRRATEVPDVGEPFDVKAYLATLPPPEKNEAAQLIRHALANLKEQRNKVDHELGWPRDPNWREINEKSDTTTVRRAINDAYDWTFVRVVCDGWPAEDKRIGAWLDQLFRGEWASEIQKISHLPLGTLEDPRFFDGSKWPTQTFQLGADCGKMARLLVARGLQLQARGDSRGALNQLESALAISRQLQNNGLYDQVKEAESIEKEVLTGYGYWLEKIGADKDLLRAGLDVLQRHQEVSPTLANSFQAEYVVATGDQRSFREQYKFREQSNQNLVITTSKRLANELRKIALDVPWEEERQRHLVNSVFASELQNDSEPIRNGQIGFPLKSGPGANLDAREWNDLLAQFRFTHPYLSGEFINARRDFARRKRQLHAVEIVTALGLYYTDHQKAPASLDDLAPAFFASMPIDPLTGGTFGYRISEGEQIELRDSRPLTLAPGQPVVFSEKREWWVPDLYLPAPSWVK